MNTRILRTNFLLKQLEKKFSGANMNGGGSQLIIKDFSRILIVSPHPDDEVIGCGGIIQKIKSNSTCEVKVCFVTIEDLRSISKPEYNERGENKRFEESKEAQKILGYEDAEYFLIPERTLDIPGIFKEMFLSSLKKLLFEYRPTIIFLPNHYDMNPDHRSICREGIWLINELISQNNIKVEALFLYEIWGPVNATHNIVLSNEMVRLKTNAMNCYKTQLKTADYFSIIEKIQELRGGASSGDLQEGFEQREYFEFVSTKSLSKYIIDNFQI
ncbi:PIG-L deacetylase family protein [Sphingobacterium sp. HSC-15S19]|uniref:PIG-L deacetylase family protein n=1 Tax=Sphingobacterium sp. HSC-15S19 TaxID=2910971 RepID=UPI003D223289